MKKIYALLAVAMMSVNLFAAPAQIPSASDLVEADYNPSTNVVLCLYLDQEGEALVCNDIVLAGSYNGWSNDPLKCEKFAELDGFPGWWAVQVPYEDGIMAKPLQLTNDGDFGSDWDFQSGDPDAWVHLGGLSAAIEVENGNESKVKYGAAGAYIYELKYWKSHKSPCVSVTKYNYTIYLIDPYCDSSEEEYIPVAVGSFSKWLNAPMSEGSIDVPADHPAYNLNGKFAYVITFVGEADQKLKFRESRCVTKDDWSNQLQYNENGSWVDFSDYFMPTPPNGKDTIIVFNYGDTEKYRYSQCGLVLYDITLNAKLPANAPEIVELMGNFKGGVWDDTGDVTGVIMTKLEDGTYTAQIKGDGDNEFKFRSGVGSNDEKWANQIWKFDDQTEEWKECGNFVFGNEEWEFDEDELTAICEVDLSDYDAFRWATDVPGPGTGIENVVLTEKARKVVVDGQLYIIRDNKLFNIHGAQLR